MDSAFKTAREWALERQVKELEARCAWLERELMVSPGAAITEHAVVEDMTLAMPSPPMLKLDQVATIRGRWEHPERYHVVAKWQPAGSDHLEFSYYLNSGERTMVRHEAAWVLPQLHERFLGSLAKTLGYL
jgi:hypothetical protein